MSKMNKALILLALVPLSTAWNGYALSLLWGWFIVPLFGMRPLGVFEAAGVSFVVFVFAGQMHVHENKARETGETVFRMIIIPAVVIAFGALYRWAAGL